MQGLSENLLYFGFLEAAKTEPRFYFLSTFFEMPKVFTVSALI